MPSFPTHDRDEPRPKHRLTRRGRRPSRLEYLTDAFIGKLQPLGAEYSVHDAEERGLSIRVRPSGAKSFILRTRGAKPLYLGLADMGVELARNKVARIRKGIEDGREPTAFARPAANVAQSFEIYVASSGFLREWRSKVRLTFERRILPDLGHLTLSALTASAIDRAIRSQARPASMARQDFYIVRAFLKWAVVHMRVDANVLAGVPAPARGMRRKTGLYLEDLQYIWACAAGLAPPWPGFFRIAILTGKSSSQVIKMQGRDLPWRREMWGEEQIEPDLREAMVEAFSSLPDWNDYLFTRTENGTPMWFRQRVMTQLRHLCQIGRFTCQEIQSAVRRETAAGLYDQLQWARVLMLPAPPSLITDDEVVL